MIPVARVMTIVLVPMIRAVAVAVAAVVVVVAAVVVATASTGPAIPFAPSMVHADQDCE
jgi:hypothetical protein